MGGGVLGMRKKLPSEGVCGSPTRLIDNPCNTRTTPLANPDRSLGPSSGRPNELAVIMGKTDASEKKKSVSRAEKAGIRFPVSKVNRHLKDKNLSKRVGAGAPVYLAAVLEYAAVELLDLASKELGSKRKRITDQDVMNAVRGDEELNRLLYGCAVFSGDRVKGVMDATTWKPAAKKNVEA